MFLWINPMFEYWKTCSEACCLISANAYWVQSDAMWPKVQWPKEFELHALAKENFLWNLGSCVKEKFVSNHKELTNQSI